VKYACIDRHRDQFRLDAMCNALEVTPGGYHAWRRRGPSEREKKDTELRIVIRSLFRSWDGTYGSPRIHDELRAMGYRVSRKRVERLMRDESLVSRPRPRFVVTTLSEHSEAIAPNLLQRRFDVGEPDEAWAADITYVPTAEGWLFLAVILDIGTRRIVGWNTGTSLDASLTLTALRRALNWRRPKADMIHHSDRGIQYAAVAYRHELTRHGVRQSMSRAGNCWDNAVAESFFATLEWELIQRRKWATRREASEAIAHYIEITYNHRRRHSSLGRISPAQYEAQLMDARHAA
jgi:transposase InsO family protein